MSGAEEVQEEPYYLDDGPGGIPVCGVCSKNLQIYLGMCVWCYKEFIGTRRLSETPEEWKARYGARQGHQA